MKVMVVLIRPLEVQTLPLMRQSLLLPRRKLPDFRHAEMLLVNVGAFSSEATAGNVRSQ